MKYSSWISVCAFSLLLAAGTAAGQDTASEDDDSDVITISKSGPDEFDPSKFKIDTSIPAYPATALLGESNVEVENFATAEDFGARLVGLTDDDGKITPGVALAATPFWWLRENITTEEYQSSYASRVAARTQFSFAVVSLSESETETQAGGTSYGVGFTTEFLDTSDPRFDEETKECVRGVYFKEDLTIDVNAEAAKRAADEIRRNHGGSSEMTADFLSTNTDPVPGLNGKLWVQLYDETLQEKRKAVRGEWDEIIAKSNKAEEAAYKECGTAAEQRAAKQASLKLGVAARFDQLKSGSDDFQDKGQSVWLAYRHGVPVDSLTSANVFLRYDNDHSEMMPESDDMMTGMETQELAKFDAWKAGLGVARVDDNFKASASVAYIDKDYQLDELDDSNYALVSVGASYKVSDGIWLDFSLGWSDDDMFSNDRYTRLELKADWGQLLGSN